MPMTVKTLLITDSSVTAVVLPSDWNPSNNTVEAWGGGGSSIVCGGGGAAWAVKRNFSGAPGQSVPVQISPSSTAANGIDPVPTWFASATILKAASGKSAPFVGGDKQMPGGQASDCVGDAANSGGSSGINNDFSPSSHSGGGAAASPSGNGADGGNASTGITETLGDGHGGSSPGAGAGGAVVAAPSNGMDGSSNENGGGGGSVSNQGTKGGDGGFPGGGAAGGDAAGAVGAGGQIRLTWTVQEASQPTTQGPSEGNQMLNLINLVPVNGQQIIPLKSGSIGVMELILSALTAPSAGTVSIDGQPFGTSSWVRVNGATNLSLVGIDAAPLAVSDYGHFSKLRFTIAGLAGSPQSIQGAASFNVAMADDLFVGLRAMNTQSYVETNVKLGVQFYIQYLLPALAAGATHKIVVNTGAKPVLVKGRDLYAAGANVLYQVFKAPVGVTGGTPLTIQNYNDINPVASTVSASFGVTTTSDGTSWGDASPLYGSTLAGGRVGSGLAPGGDRVLKPNASYLVSVKNADSAALQVGPAWFLTWYEGNPDLPRS